MKRFIATATAVFERFVDQVENHEAVAESLIREVTTSAAQIKVQGKRLDAEIGRLTAEKTKQEKVRERWRGRAADLAEGDEARALECVRRMRAADRLAQSIAEQLQEQTDLRDQLRRDLENVEARLRELRLRKTSLAARGARSRALSGSVEPGDTVVEGVFDRWEAQVVRDEYKSDVVRVETVSADAFEQAFDEAEDDAELAATLAEIVASAAEGKS